MNNKYLITILLLISTLTLTACAGGGGGGGGGGGSSATPSPQQPELRLEDLTLPPIILDYIRDSAGRITGTITVIVTGPDGFSVMRTVTVADDGRIIGANFRVPTTGEYAIAIEVRDAAGSLLTRLTQDADTNAPTQFNITTPITAIPQPNQMTLLWDNLVEAQTFLVEWSPPRQADPRTQIQIEGPRTRYTVFNLANNISYTFTIHARNRSATTDLATYRVVNVPGPNNDNDTLIDRLDPDDDNDGRADAEDNCPRTANPQQTNSDTDDYGDACDAFPNDSDNDGIDDSADNCPTDPNPACIRIATAQDLRTQIVPGASGYYRLAADITLTRTWASTFNFRGTLHGNNHVITFSLLGRDGTPILDHSSTLLDTINSTATVTQIGIRGGTLAITNHGNISHAHATGKSDGVCINTTCYNGGLVSINYGTIDNSYATGNSQATDMLGLGLSGGLVGQNRGTIANSYATGRSNSSLSGGLVGQNYGTITNSYATGDSSGSSDSGGLVGQNRGTITNSYATGDSSSNGDSGGLVGQNRGTITNSYATGDGSSTSSGFSGGLVGRDDGGSITASYRVQTTGTNMLGIAQTLTQLRSATSYNGWSPNIWDFGTPSDLPTLRNMPPCPAGNPACRHRLPDLDNDGFADAEDNCPRTANPQQTNRDNDDYGDACDALPTNPTEHLDSDGDRVGDNQDNCPLTSNPQQVDTDTDSYGDACDSCPTIPSALDPDAPYCQDISSAQDMIDSFTTNTSGYFRLTANIIIATTWTPTADFRGTFNGDNHTIIFSIPGNTFLDTINRTATVANIGILHGTLAFINHGTISHAYATGNSSSRVSGGLVDENFGTITHSYATGNSNGSSVSGGLVGGNRGTITHSHATGNSNGTSSSGGLVGVNRGTITSSHATGNSRSRSNATNSFSGGLVGSNGRASTITASYATGNSHSSGDNVSSASGGLAGTNHGTITNSYAIGDSSSDSRRGTFFTSSSGGLVGTNFGTIANAYATGTSSSDSDGDFSTSSSGGLVGLNDFGSSITNTYATGTSSSDSLGMLSTSSSGGLVGSNSFGTITASYRVQTTGNTLGTAITLPNLRTATSFSGWLSPPWDFGTTSQLPQHESSTGIPLCPGATSYSVTSCRW